MGIKKSASSIVNESPALNNGVSAVKGRQTPIADTGGMKSTLPPALPPPSGYIINPSPLLETQLEQVWGDSGTERWSGFFYEEPNAQMRDWDRVDRIEEMRRMDGACKGALTAVKAPILATEWRVEGEDEDIVKFVEDNIFKMRRPWKDFIRESHNYLDFGFSIFEKIWERRGDFLYLADLEPRIQHSIFRFRMSDGEPGITQVIKTDEFPRAYAEIPLEKLIILTNEKEGDDITGQSILRAAYKHYHFKDVLYRIQGIAAERNGVGTPLVELPDGFGPEEKAKVEEALSEYRSNEKAFLIVPSGMKVSILTPNSNAQGSSIVEAIGHHNVMILQTVLATFLGLGQDGTGSFALSKDLSSFFLKVVEDKCSYFAEQFTKQVIEPLVRINFGPDADVPELKFSPLGDIDFKEMSDALVALANASLIKKDGAMMQYIAKQFKLPEISDTEVDEIDSAEDVTEADPSVRPLQPNQPNETGTTPEQLLKPPTPFNVNGPANPAALPANQSKGGGKLPNGKPNPDKMAKPGEMHEFLKEKPFKLNRDMTMQERRSDFQWLNEQFNELQSDLRQKLDSIGAEAGLNIAKNVRDKAKAGNYAAIGSEARELVPKLQQAIQETTEKAHDVGATLAAKELREGGIAGAQVPPLTPELQQLRKVDIEDTAMTYLGRLENYARAAATAALTAGVDPSAIASSLRTEVVEEAERMANNVEGSLIGEVINTARQLVFKSQSEHIAQFERSEIIDDVTCDLCLSLDQRVLPADDPMTNLDAFHDWCRGIWIPILATDDLLDYDPIPKSILDHIDTVGGVPVRNGAAQLKKPIARSADARDQVKKNSKK